MPRNRTPLPRAGRRSRWAYLSLMPLGLGAWAPIYAGVMARRRSWIVTGTLWSACVLAGWLIGVTAHGKGAGNGGALVIFGWVAAVVHSFSVRREYEARTAGAFGDAQADARHAIADREHARELARTDPELARQMGIGRPEKGRGQDFELVDVNNAPVRVLRTLPGVDAALADEIVRVRARIHGFDALADMGSVLDLDGALVEGLRPVTVFLPRRGPA